MSSNTVLYQWERVKRKFELFEELNNGIVHTRNSSYYEDIVYDFFIHCHQMKDWVKNDTGLNQPIRNSAEGWVRTNHCLKICADIANGTKHMSLLNPSGRSGEERSVKSKTIKLTLGPEPAKISVNYAINDGSSTIDAFTLASDCLHTWEHFLQTHSII